MHFLRAGVKNPPKPERQKPDSDVPSSVTVCGPTGLQGNNNMANEVYLSHLSKYSIQPKGRSFDRSCSTSA